MTDRGSPGPRLAEWTRAIRRSVFQDLLTATARPDVISLALGLPAAELFPTAAMGNAIARILEEDPRALQYGPPSANLRAFVANLMERRGVECRPDQVFLTAGAQQGISMLARLLLDPGATVLVEGHSYTGFQQAIAACSPRVVTVPTDLERGIDLHAVEERLAVGPKPALIYAMADGHNPTGVSMPLESRVRLVEMARSHRVPIIEDDAYGLISYDGKPDPALRSLDADWVFYVGSFSKTLAPALRTGWIVAPERFVGLLATLKESSDIDTATLGQRAVAAFVASGGFDEHVAGLRAEYSKRRDAMLLALERTFPPGARWSRPRAGFFVWVELPDGLDAGRLFEIALETEMVAFLPGATLVAGDAEPARSALRLNFSYCRSGLIEDGVGRIARAIEALGREAVKEAGRG